MSEVKFEVSNVFSKDPVERQLQIDAWYNYIHTSYMAVNEYIRFGESEYMDMIEQDPVDLINLMLSVNPIYIEDELVLYRGSSPEKADYYDLINSLNVGDTMKDEAFISSALTIETAITFLSTRSRDEKTMEHICCLFKLILPKNTAVVPLSMLFSRQHTLQPDEIVILPETEWKVTDVSYVDTTKYSLHRTKIITVVLTKQKLLKKLLVNKSL